jgi:hypothetical protein
MQSPPSPIVPPLTITAVRISLNDDDRLKAFVRMVLNAACAVRGVKDERNGIAGALGARLPDGPHPLIAKAALEPPAEFVQP